MGYALVRRKTFRQFCTPAKRSQLLGYFMLALPSNAISLAAPATGSRRFVAGALPPRVPRWQMGRQALLEGGASSAHVAGPAVPLVREI